MVRKRELIPKQDEHGRDILCRADAVTIRGSIDLIKRMGIKGRRLSIIEWAEVMKIVSDTFEGQHIMEQCIIITIT